MESILTSIKKMLGIAEEYEHFDQDLIMHINSVFMVLNQLGVGPAEGFSISDKNATWDEFISTTKNLNAVKSYIFLKVRLLFDPPTSSAVMDCINRSISEYEWRLNVEVEDTKTSGEEVNRNG